MLKKFLIGFGVLAIILTIFPFVALDYWWIRVFDFPHIQLTLLTLFAFLVYFIRFDVKNVKDYAFISVIAACLIFQFSKIYPYTFLNDMEVNESSASNSTTLKIYTSNVLQKNKNKDLLLADLKKVNPDVVLLTETDQKWIDAVSVFFDGNYQKQLVPLDNTYGMALYSKLEFVDIKTEFLVSDSIPSIHGKLKMKDGKLLQFYAIHPTPPVPQENDMSTDRDAEMMMIAKMSLERELPTLVFGDFNDVAWSETSQLFKNVSTLLDARLGRGFFNTYSAKSYILKWPLDHIFVSEEFRIKNIEVRGDINSDHYPLYTEFTFEPELANEQKPNQPTKSELERANTQINKYKESERKN